MPKRGRPRKYHTEEEARAAANTASRASRRRRGEAQQQQQPRRGGLQIEFDPRSILQQAGVEGDAQITALDRGIQAEGLNVPIDEDRLQFLEVATRGILSFSLNTRRNHS
jgi:hypothetical protein